MNCKIKQDKVCPTVTCKRRMGHGRKPLELKTSPTRKETAPDLVALFSSNFKEQVQLENNSQVLIEIWSLTFSFYSAEKENSESQL